jgi:hypothetical protein
MSRCDGELLKRADVAWSVAVNVALEIRLELQLRKKDEAAGTNCQPPD